MRLLRHYLRGALVWMTAVSVLLAGIPRYQCLCPDGSLKLFCLGWAPGKDGCCSGACCPAPGRQGGDRAARKTPAKPAKKACCCCHDQRSPDDQGADTQPRLASSGCQKTVVPADFVAAPAAHRVAPERFVVAPCLPAPHQPLAPLFPNAGRRPFAWAGDRAPPPTDLIITLQHFVI
jgi:hypothetical protein